MEEPREDEGTLRATEYEERVDELAGWRGRIVTYRLGDSYQYEIDNVSPGALLTRGDGATRDEAETSAIETARGMLARTRTFPVGQSPIGPGGPWTRD